jgi:hypothetical protein
MGLRPVSRGGPIAAGGAVEPGDALPLATAGAPGAAVLRSQSKPVDLIYDQVFSVSASPLIRACDARNMAVTNG